MRYFDEQNKRLIYIGEQATPGFWDRQWKTKEEIRRAVIDLKSTYVTRVTRKCLTPDDGIILEGGCGRAKHVAALVNNGYQCIGVDFAQQTVEMINEAVPELDVRLGDVRHLDFEDASFAGYWSLGVIEHFWNGYESISSEMARVIKSGGYLFLTFPYMSPLRKLKARFGLYPKWDKEQSPTHFYQFALNHKSVIQDFTRYGFELVQAKPRDGLKGTKDEVKVLKGLLQELYDYRETSILI